MEGETTQSTVDKAKDRGSVLQSRVEDSLSPPLKWAGGKRWQLPHLLPLWMGHEGRRLVEPFCGGLAVTLGLRPERALLNDINSHLVNFYIWLQRGLRLTRVFENDERYYYAQRRKFNALSAEGKDNSREAAALFYYLNRTGYNGLCRFNRSGQFNVPFGRYSKINYKQDFIKHEALFKNWQFTCVDFEEIDLNASDFVYADPPYDVQFTQYFKGGFDWEEQVRTAQWASRREGPTVLVNQATERIVELYGRLGFKLKFLSAPRRISCTGDRRPAKEVLAFLNLE